MSNSATTTEACLPLPRTGGVLKSEFLEPMGLSAHALAKALRMPRSRIYEIARGRQYITAAIALRLGRFFDVDPQWFLNMQSRYDLKHAEATIDVSCVAPRKAT